MEIFTLRLLAVAITTTVCHGHVHGDTVQLSASHDKTMFPWKRKEAENEDVGNVNQTLSWSREGNDAWNSVQTLSWSVRIQCDTTFHYFCDDGQYKTSANLIAHDLQLLNKGQIGHLSGIFLFEHVIHAHGLKYFRGLSSDLIHPHLNLTSQDALQQAHPVSHDSQNASQVFVTPPLPTVFLPTNNVSEWISVAMAIDEGLQSHPLVVWHRQQVFRKRMKRSVKFNDPAYRKQWHLVNYELPLYDVNVTGVWAAGITGRNTNVVVVDDGLEWTNPDIRGNYNQYGSWDINSNDNDPMPSTESGKNHHGTRCAGEIAAVANNGHCGVGVAYDAGISAIRVLDGPMTDSLEAIAFTKNYDINDIYSCSWGPDDDGATVDGPHYLANVALRHGVEYGRQGYGSIYVVASGNGGRVGDNCNFDGYANSIYTVTVGAVDDHGRMPYYAEECASMLAVTFSSGGGITRGIVTTDWLSHGATGCTDGHSGTSAAAPLAAGMIALMLQVQPCLTWRDVQYLLIITAKKVDVDLAHWYTNTAGLHHSHKHGFGLMDAWRLVTAAQTWQPVPWMTVFSSQDVAENKAIPSGPNPQPLSVTYTVTLAHLSGYALYSLEYVQVAVTISHSRRGDLDIRLLCPSRTESVIAAPRKPDNSTEGFTDWIFSTVRCWGERPEGVWTLTVTDKGSQRIAGSRGQLIQWRLKLFGSPMTPEEFKARKLRAEESYSGAGLVNRTASPCSPPPVTTKLAAPLSQKILKILVLTGVFCLFLAVYESLEYAFCFEEEKKTFYEKLKKSREEERSAPEEGSSRQVMDDTNEGTRLLDAEEVPLNDPPDLDLLHPSSDIIQHTRVLQNGRVPVPHHSSSLTYNTQEETSFIEIPSNENALFIGQSHHCIQEIDQSDCPAVLDGEHVQSSHSSSPDSGASFGELVSHLNGSEQNHVNSDSTTSS